jgi:hypothetical protein
MAQCLRYYTHREYFNRSTSDSLQTLKKRVVELSNEIQKQEAQVQTMRESAERKSKAVLFLGGSVAFAQLGTIFMGTFHYLCWDIMEPICYLMTFGNFTCGYFFYLWQKQDLELSNLHDILTYRMTKKAAMRKGINLDDLEEKKQELATLNAKLAKAYEIH